MSCPAIPSPSPLQPQGAKEHPQDGIPQALSHGVMEVPLCSSFRLAAAAEHQLGSERGRGETEEGNFCQTETGGIVALALYLRLADGGRVSLDGWGWHVAFSGPKAAAGLGVGLGALAQAWPDRTGEKKEKTLNLPHVSLIVSGAPRIGGVQWGGCGNAVQITESKMSECQTVDDRRCKKQTNTETEPETETNRNEYGVSARIAREG